MDEGLPEQFQKIKETPHNGTGFDFIRHIQEV
jgi:hypothetical protein